MANLAPRPEACCKEALLHCAAELRAATALGTCRLRVGAHPAFGGRSTFGPIDGVRLYLPEPRWQLGNPSHTRCLALVCCPRRRSAKAKDTSGREVSSVQGSPDGEGGEGTGVDARSAEWMRKSLLLKLERCQL